MIKELIKSDLKYIFKGSGIFIILLIISAILQNLTSYDTTFSFNENGEAIAHISAPVLIQFLHTIFYNCVICFTVALVFNLAMRIWTHFRRTMYGNASYLTHTLPLKRSSIWTAKCLSAISAIIIAGFAIALTFLLLSLTESGQGLIGSLGFMLPPSSNSAIVEQNSSSSLAYNLGLALGAFSEGIFIIFSGFLGIILGHRQNNHKVLYSCLFGFIVYLAVSPILLLALTIFSNISPELSAIFGNDTATLGANFIIKLFSSISVAYLCFDALYYFFGRKLLHSGIDAN